MPVRRAIAGATTLRWQRWRKSPNARVTLRQPSKSERLKVADPRTQTFCKPRSLGRRSSTRVSRNGRYSAHTHVRLLVPKVSIYCGACKVRNGQPLLPIGTNTQFLINLSSSCKARQKSDFGHCVLHILFSRVMACLQSGCQFLKSECY